MTRLFLATLLLQQVATKAPVAPAPEPMKAVPMTMPGIATIPPGQVMFPANMSWTTTAKFPPTLTREVPAFLFGPDQTQPEGRRAYSINTDKSWSCSITSYVRESAVTITCMKTGQ